MKLNHLVNPKNSGKNKKPYLSSTQHEPSKIQPGKNTNLPSPSEDQGSSEKTANKMELCKLYKCLHLTYLGMSLIER